MCRMNLSHDIWDMLDSRSAHIIRYHRQHVIYVMRSCCLSHAPALPDSRSKLLTVRWASASATGPACHGTPHVKELFQACTGAPWSCNSSQEPRHKTAWARQGLEVALEPPKETSVESPHSREPHQASRMKAFQIDHSFKAFSVHSAGAATSPQGSEGRPTQNGTS